jgi:hypothetical protein
MNLIDRFLLSCGYMRIPEPGQTRLCRLCGKQIKRGHRWHVKQGRPEHWECLAPEAGPGNQWTKKILGAIPDDEQTSLTLGE